MRKVINSLPEDKQKLMREIISRYLDHNPAIRMSPADLKKNTKGKIEQFAKDATHNR